MQHAESILVIIVSTTLALFLLIAIVVLILIAKLVSSILRNLAHVEHQSAPDIAHPVTLEQMKPYIQRRLERFKTNPGAPSTEQGVRNYPVLKAREAESLAESNRLIEQARRVAMPRPHEFALSPAE